MNFKRFALMGMFPKANPLNISMMGYHIVISIVPVARGGGAMGPSRIPYDEQTYKIVVVISRKGKTWREERELSYLQLKSLEKVVAAYKGMTTFVNKIKVQATHLGYTILESLRINIRSKNKE